MKGQVKNFLKSHAQSLYLVAGCLMVLGTLFFFTVVRDKQTHQKLNRQLTQAKTQLARQKALAPLYDDLQKKYALTIPGLKTLPDKIPLSETDAASLDTVFRDMIQSCDLRLLNLTPDIQSILSDEDFLRVDLTTSGNFRDFKQLLMQVGQLPFLAAIDQFRIERRSEKDPLEMYLRLRLVKE